MTIHTDLWTPHGNEEKERVSDLGAIPDWRTLRDRPVGMWTLAVSYRATADDAAFRAMTHGSTTIRVLRTPECDEEKGMIGAPVSEPWRDS